MWHCGRMVEEKGGLSHQLTEVLKLFQCIYEDGDEPTDEELALVNRLLEMDRDEIEQVFQPPPPEAVPDEAQDAVQELNALYDQIGVDYLRAIDELCDYAYSGDAALAEATMKSIQQASARLELADSRAHRLTEGTLEGPDDDFIAGT